MQQVSEDATTERDQDASKVFVLSIYKTLPPYKPLEVKD